MGDLQRDVLYRNFTKEDRAKLVEAGDAIRAARPIYDYSIVDLARASGVSQTTISLVERGLIIPSERVLKALCKVLFDEEKKGWAFAYEKMAAMYPSKPRRGRRQGESDSTDPEKWPEGRKYFASLLRRDMELAQMTPMEVAAATPISLIYVKQILSGRHPIPPLGVCRRLAKTLGVPALSYLLLRTIAVTDPKMRRGFLDLFFPRMSAFASMEPTKISDHMMKRLHNLGWRQRV